jgi:DNA modification methylase
MSRFIQGDCEQVMSGFPSNAVDFILTDPPYLVGFTDRTGRTIANDKQGDWLLPVSKEMFRVLKPNSLAVSFYVWNRVDLFMQAWKAAGFRVVTGLCRQRQNGGSDDVSPSVRHRPDTDRAGTPADDRGRPGGGGAKKP